MQPKWGSIGDEVLHADREDEKARREHEEDPRFW